jgi:nucleoside transporter
MSEPSKALSRRADPRLHIMMFFQYAVWGIWVPILALYFKTPVAEGGLGFNGYEIGMILGTAMAVGTVLAPFIGGQLADRHFSTQRFLAVSMLIGGAINWVLADQTGFWPWLILSTIYAIVYMPTIGLTNSLAMSHLSDSKRQFPGVRVWGTIGWIVVAWVFPMVWLQSDLSFRWLPPFFKGVDLPNATSRIADALKASGLLSVVYGVFCLFLPDTPPNRNAKQRFAFAKAFGLVRHRSVLVLILATLPLAVIHKIFFLQAAPFLQSIGLDKGYIMPAMSIGQFAEIAVMLFLGLMLSRLGFRWVLFIGAFSYVLRYALFGMTDLPMWATICSLAFHGLIFAGIWATSFMYIDRMAPPDVRHSAQTGFIIIQLGMGPIIGAWLNGFLESRFTTDGVLNYQLFWWTCAAIGLVAAIAMAALFRDESKDPAAVSGGEE